MFDQCDYREFCQYLSDNSGITLADNKSYLIKTRLKTIFSDYNIESLKDLVDQLKSNNSRLSRAVIDAMTTNETFWFRDNYPFDYLKSVLLPRWISSNKPIKIWCAACSTGQEPYSLSMAIEEYYRDHPNDSRISLSILATDLSSRVLGLAEQGIYDSLAMNRGLSIERRQRFFKENSGKWEISSSIKKPIRFSELNLLKSFDQVGSFDMIFCRNVLIYFDQTVKTSILTKLHKALKPDGLLCLGSPEALAQASHLFSMVHCHPGILYARNP